MEFDVIDIELAEKEELCGCNKKIFIGEPMGICKTGQKVCFYCAKENLTELKNTYSFLIKKLDKLYNKNIKIIIANRL